jgi:ABC-type branched-subunit amino acid transport system ATPase component
MGAGAMLRLDGVDVQIQGARVLRGVTMELERGRTASLVGRNGAGKTTLLRTIMGLVALTAGSIRLGGSELHRHAAHRIPALGVGFAPEDRRLFPSLTVEENLTLPLSVNGVEAKERSERLALLFGILPDLPVLLTRKAGSLSGGQQKIVALGRALALGRTLVLLDEPFQGLAPALAHRYAEALASTRAKVPDLTILVTESNAEMVESLAEERYVIERGEVARLA